MTDVVPPASGGNGNNEDRTASTSSAATEHTAKNGNKKAEAKEKKEKATKPARKRKKSHRETDEKTASRRKRAKKGDRTDGPVSTPPPPTPMQCFLEHVTRRLPALQVEPLVAAGHTASAPNRIQLKQLAVRCYDGLGAEAVGTPRIRLATERRPLLAACCWSSCRGGLGLGCGCPLLLLDEGEEQRWTDATGWTPLGLARHLRDHPGITGGLLCCSCDKSEQPQTEHIPIWPPHQEAGLLWLLTVWRQHVLPHITPHGDDAARRQNTSSPPSPSSPPPTPPPPPSPPLPSLEDREAARLLADPSLLWQPPLWIGGSDTTASSARARLQRGEHIDTEGPPQTLGMLVHEGECRGLQWLLDSPCASSPSSSKEESEGMTVWDAEADAFGPSVSSAATTEAAAATLASTTSPMAAPTLWRFTLDAQLGATLEPLRGHQGSGGLYSFAPGAREMRLHGLPPLSTLFADVLHVPHPRMMTILQHLATLVAYGRPPRDFAELLSDIVLEEQEADPGTRYMHLPLDHTALLDHADLLIEQLMIPPSAWAANMIFGAHRRENERSSPTDPIRRLLSCYATGRGGPLSDADWSLSNWRLFHKRERLLDRSFTGADGVRQRETIWFFYDGRGRHAVPYTSDHVMREYENGRSGNGTLTHFHPLLFRERRRQRRQQQKQQQQEEEEEYTWLNHKEILDGLSATRGPTCPAIASIAPYEVRQACRQRESHGLMRAFLDMPPRRKDPNGNALLVAAFHRALDHFAPGIATRRSILDGTLTSTPAPFLALWLHVFVHVVAPHWKPPRVAAAIEKTGDEGQVCEDTDKCTAAWYAPYVPASSDMLDVVEWLQRRVHYRRERRKTRQVMTADTYMRYLLLRPRTHTYAVVEVLRISRYDPVAKEYTHFGQTSRVLPVYPSPPPTETLSSPTSLKQQQSQDSLSLFAWNKELAEAPFLLRYQLV